MNKIATGNIIPELDNGTDTNLWEKRRALLTRYRRKVVCDGNYKAELYEFSVQENRGCTRYVVYCRNKYRFHFEERIMGI